MKSIHLATLSRRAAYAAACALMVLGALPQVGTAGNDGTIGSLPSADSGDGCQAFYLTGPRRLVEEVILTAGGSGFYVWTDLTRDSVWIEFYGDVMVTFDRQFLASHSELEIGVTAGIVGKGMLVDVVVGGRPSGDRIFVPNASSLPTPYERIAPLLAHGMRLETTQRLPRAKATVIYDEFGGMLNVSQRME